jgi:excinuclease ABC subunit C
MRIRDEAHRFGITFHRRLRGKEQLHSLLDAIEGIGPKRKQRLLQTLGSYKRVTEAGVEELAVVPGIGAELARQIYRQLHGEEHGTG